jgi:hypothetical protein
MIIIIMIIIITETDFKHVSACNLDDIIFYCCCCYVWKAWTLTVTSTERNKS